MQWLQVVFGTEVHSVPLRVLQKIQQLDDSVVGGQLLQVLLRRHETSSAAGAVNADRRGHAPERGGEVLAVVLFGGVELLDARHAERVVAREKFGRLRVGDGERVPAHHAPQERVLEVILVQNDGALVRRAAAVVLACDKT